jgi:hypothetical protein
MITIRCARCKTRILRYFKKGKGKVLYCYKDRISKWYLQADKEIRCPCGNLIAIEDGDRYKMIQGAFTFTGTVEK